MSRSSTLNTTGEHMSEASAAQEDGRMDTYGTPNGGQLGEATPFTNDIDGNRLPERKSLLKKIFALLAPQLFADERVVYETQSRRPRA